MADLITISALVGLAAAIGDVWQRAWSTGRKWSVTIAFILALLAVQISVIAVEWRGASRQAEGNVELFLQSVSGGDFSAAYSLLSTDAKQATSAESFARSMASSVFTGYRGVQRTNFNFAINLGGPKTYDYEGRVSYLQGDHGNVTAGLVKEAGHWRIQSINVDR